MPKFFVTSDIHSFCTPLKKALDKKGFDPNNEDHWLVVCGDVFDRGDESKEVLYFLMSLERKILVKGNHEWLLEQCVNEISRGVVPGRHHFSNGTIKTICQFCGENEWIIYDPSWRDKICKTMQPILDFIHKNCVNYAEIGDYIMVHGWIPSFQHLDDFRDATDDEWEESMWWNGMEMWKNPKNRVNGKTIVCGHYHCSWGWSHIKQKRKEFPQKSKKDWEKSFEPFVEDGIIAIDSCVAHTGLINCVVLECD